MMEKNTQNMCTAVLLCVTVVLCTCLFCSAMFRYKRVLKGNGITATGSASLDFESDLIVWRGRFGVNADSLEGAYKKLRFGSELVKQYLEGEEIRDDEMLFGSVEIERRTTPVYDEFGNLTEYREAGYHLTQNFLVSSEELDKVAAVSRNISELIASGVELESDSPQYYCTRLDEIKMELVEEASANARERIERMAGQAGARMGKLATASLGVFQITALHSGTGDYGATGTLDTTSRYKTAMITVKLNYGIN